MAVYALGQIEVNRGQKGLQRQVCLSETGIQTRHFKKKNDIISASTWEFLMNSEVENF